MKRKLSIGLFTIALGISAVSCSSESSTGMAALEDALKEMESTLDQEMESISHDEPEAPALVVSAEMEDFCNVLKGEGILAALEKYGASEGIKDHDMGMYDLKDPKVISGDESCYTLECTSGVVTNTYDVCWEGGMINKITERM